MIFFEALLLVISTCHTTGEIFVSDTSFPPVEAPQIMQRQFFLRLPGLVAPPRVPVPAPAPAPYVPPRPVPVLPPPTTVTASVNAPGISRVPGSALQPCSSKCCLRYCKFIGSCDSAVRKKECLDSQVVGAAPQGADKCYNAEADGCLPKQCSMPTSCKNPCSTVIDIITEVAFCEP